MLTDTAFILFLIPPWQKESGILFSIAILKYFDVSLYHF